MFVRTYTFIYNAYSLLDCKCHVVDALEEITSTMGATYWTFNAESCKIDAVGITPEPPPLSESKIVCDCNYENNTVCHVVKMYDFLIFLFLFSQFFSKLFFLEKQINFLIELGNLHLRLTLSDVSIK